MTAEGKRKRVAHASAVPSALLRTGVDRRYSNAEASFGEI